MDASTVEALTTLQNAYMPSTWQMSLWTRLIMAVLVMIVVGMGAASFTDWVDERRGTVRNQTTVAAVVFCAFATTMFVSIWVAFGMHRAEARENERAMATYVAVVVPACGAVLEAIAQGQVTVMTRAVSRTVETRCGAAEFMVAMNAPGSRLDADFRVRAAMQE